MTEEEIKNLNDAKRLFGAAHKMIKDYAITLYKAKSGLENINMSAGPVRDKLYTSSASISIGHIMVKAEECLNKVIPTPPSDGR